MSRGFWTEGVGGAIILGVLVAAGTLAIVAVLAGWGR
jgi:hypothetical protein